MPTQQEIDTIHRAGDSNYDRDNQKSDLSGSTSGSTSGGSSGGSSSGGSNKEKNSRFEGNKKSSNSLC
jgi:hypothetical protein